MLNRAQSDTDAIATIAARLSGAPVSAVTQVLGGGNNRIFRIDGAAAPFALKIYYSDDGGGAKRLTAEYNGLEFLWRNGIRRILS